VNRINDIRKSVDIKHMYVGLDFHKATINPTVMDENGIVLNKVKIKYTIDLLLRSSYLRWILTQVTWANIRKEPNGTVGNFLPIEEKG